MLGAATAVAQDSLSAVPVEGASYRPNSFLTAGVARVIVMSRHPSGAWSTHRLRQYQTPASNPELSIRPMTRFDVQHHSAHAA